jgi:hypothetical protein
MKNTPRCIVSLLFLMISLTIAQDVQPTYEEAKIALLDGDYKTALEKIDAAKAQIQADPKLDPNLTFSSKLLPALETSARKVAEVARALENLYNRSMSNLVFMDLPATLESVEQYNKQAQKFSAGIIRQRDSLLNDPEIPSEYREALLKIPVVQDLESEATTVVMQKLSDKVMQLTSVVIDSLVAVDGRFKKAEERIEKMLKTAAANKTDMDTMTKELAQLSQERLNYLNAISQMLEGEVTPEIVPIRKSLTDNQVQDAFAHVIESEINRLHEITLIDSTGYKELLRSYDRIKNYDQIFSQNKIGGDQSTLLAQYEQALKAIKVEEPKKLMWSWGIIAGIIVVIAGIIIVVPLVRKKRTGSRTD